MVKLLNILKVFTNNYIHMWIILLFNIRQKYSVTYVVANINHAKRKKCSPSKTHYKKIK